MTTTPDPFDTGASIVVLSVLSLRSYHLFPVPGWRPVLTEDPAGAEYTDPLFGITVTILVALYAPGVTDELRYLQADPHRCPLCHDQRHIRVRLDLRDTAAYTSGLLDAAFDDGPRPLPFTDVAKPCPACRPAEYQLSGNDDTAEFDL